MDAAGLADGALYAAQSPLALGAILAACLACRPASRRAAAAMAALLGVSLLSGYATPDTWPAATIAACVLGVLGVFVAANGQFRAASPLALVPGGFAAALAAGVPTATPAEAAGSVALLLVPGAALLLARASIRWPARLQLGASIARRMAGAWITAVGILLLALRARGVL
ncbi:hypothetical protein [Ramlibacter algicola]|uniref:Uncharacterized protein n=1 Tax=Ramlibacter algicola TaxID=2795217 RepID=A0A934UPV2_9BURK|nr:hypothetical protein [Ramlibacter algicola]MBK0391151.1 hypothetical protein [Ramlibacter algicola]